MAKYQYINWHNIDALSSNLLFNFQWTSREKEWLNKRGKEKRGEREKQAKIDKQYFQLTELSRNTVSELFNPTRYDAKERLDIYVKNEVDISSSRMVCKEPFVEEQYKFPLRDYGNI